MIDEGLRSTGRSIGYCGETHLAAGAYVIVEGHSVELGDNINLVELFARTVQVRPLLQEVDASLSGPQESDMETERGPVFRQHGNHVTGESCLAGSHAHQQALLVGVAGVRTEEQNYERLTRGRSQHLARTSSDEIFCVGSGLDESILLLVDCLQERVREKLLHLKWIC